MANVERSAARSFAIGWRQVAICFVLLATDSTIASSYGVVAVPLGGEFHPSRMVLMLTMTIMAGGTALLSPVLGNLMDRVALRGLMMLGGLFLAAGYAALSFATSFTQVLAVYGLFLAPANVLIGPVAATVLISHWFVKRRGTAIGIAIAGIAVGGIVFPPLIQWLLDNHAWRDALRLFALVVVVCTISAAAFIVNAPADKGLNPDGAAEAHRLADRTGGAHKPSVRTFFTDPTFWLVAIVLAVVTSGMKGMVTNLSPLAVDLGIKATDAAWLVSVFSACGFVSKIGFAGVADRLSPHTLMLISLGGFACGTACLTQAHDGYWVIALGVGLIGLFGGQMVPMQSFIVPRIYGERIVGRAMGLLSAVTLCALLATPPLFGFIFDMTGSYNGIFLTFTVLAIGAMLLVRHIRLHPRAETPDSGPIRREADATQVA